MRDTKNHEGDMNPRRDPHVPMQNHTSSAFRGSYFTATSLTLQICPLPSLAWWRLFFSSLASRPQNETRFSELLLLLDPTETTVLLLPMEKVSVVAVRFVIGAVRGCFLGDSWSWRRRVRRTGTLAAIIVIADSAVLQIMRTTPLSWPKIQLVGGGKRD